MTTRIKNCTLYSPQLGIVEHGELHICEDTIAYVGSAKNAPKIQVDTVIDAGGKLAMPGLINAHGHATMTLMRGRADDLPLMEWLNGAIFPAEDKLCDDDLYWGTMLGIAEMLAGGTTGFVDMYLNQRPVVQAVLQTGIRTLTGRAVTADKGERLRQALDLYEEYDGAGNGRVRVGLMPHAEYTTSVEQLKEISEIARARKIPLHMHVSETRKEHQECVSRHGVSPVGLLDHIGFLQNDVTLAHGVWITRGDGRLLAFQNVNIAHCPGSNCKLGSGIAPVAEWIKMGIPVALGTDGAASNNGLDMWREMYLMALLAKGLTLDAAALPVEQLMRCVLHNGARAIGAAGKVGELTPGYKADLILVDIGGLTFQPGGSLLSNLIYSNAAANVKLTMVDGQVLYRDGEFPGLDIQEITKNARQCSARLYA